MEITAIILAGGKSSRMGTDKGFVKIYGKSLAEHVIDSVKEVSEDIIIIANKDEYKIFGYPVFPDLISDCGPLGGIYTGLMHSATQYNLVLSCDIPFINPLALKKIISNAIGYEIAVPIHNGKTEPLCAVYSKDCISRFQQLLLKKELKMLDTFNHFNVKKIDVSNDPLFSNDTFANINSVHDLLKAESNNEN